MSSSTILMTESDCKLTTYDVLRILHLIFVHAYTCYYDRKVIQYRNSEIMQVIWNVPIIALSYSGKIKFNTYVP